MTKEKLYILKVTRCTMCPNYSDRFQRCWAHGSSFNLNNFNVYEDIPDWCPLSDYNNEGEK
jgi:hypothetical protein